MLSIWTSPRFYCLGKGYGVIKEHLSVKRGFDANAKKYCHMSAGAVDGSWHGSKDFALCKFSTSIVGSIVTCQLVQ